MESLPKECSKCKGTGDGAMLFNPHTRDVDLDACPNCMGTGKKIDWVEYWSNYDGKYDIY